MQQELNLLASQMSKHFEPDVIQDLILKQRLRNLDWTNDKQIYIEYEI